VTKRFDGAGIGCARCETDCQDTGCDWRVVDADRPSNKPNIPWSGALKWDVMRLFQKYA
jgi:hypothetical protein